MGNYVNNSAENRYKMYIGLCMIIQQLHYYNSLFYYFKNIYKHCLDYSSNPVITSSLELCQNRFLLLLHFINLVKVLD